MIQTATFHFFESLNDFLPVKNKNTPVVYSFTGNPSIKDAIEAIGIPHTEVDVILSAGLPVSFENQLIPNSTFEIYSFEHNFPGHANYSVTPPLPADIKFIADVHLGKLANAMRTIGIDTYYDTKSTDKQIAEIAFNQERVVLTRDVGLLKHKTIKWGLWLRSQQHETQLQEVEKKYNISSLVNAFTRCLICNGDIIAVPKDEILNQLPAKTREYFNQFYQCNNCKKIYWKGSHYEHMLEKLKSWLKQD